MRSAITGLLLVCPSFVGCQSVESQRRLFVTMHDAQIGEPFYLNEKAGTKERRLETSVSEFVPDTIPHDRAVVAWTVDTSKRGAFRQPGGGTLPIEGIKQSWRVIGDPSLARVEINWRGPW